MARPLENTDKANRFDIGEILDNPSIFGKSALNKSSSAQKSISDQNSSKRPSSTDHRNIGATIASSSVRMKRSISSEVGKEDRFKRVANTTKDDKIADLNANSLRSEETVKKVTYENYQRPSSITRFNQSSYNVMEIIQRKRTLRNATAHLSAESDQANSNKETDNNSRKVPKFQQPKSTKKSFRNESKTLNQSESTSIVDLTIDEEPRQDFLRDILKWNTIWFRNANNVDPPKLCEEKAQHLKLSYSSVAEYIQYYKPLVLHEIWAQIAERVISLKKSMPNKVTLFINTYEAEDNFLVFNCVLPITNEDLNSNSYPLEGDLIVAEMSKMKDSKEDENTLALAYISKYFVDEITEKTILSKNVVCPPRCKKLLRYIIKSNLMNVKINVEKHIRCSSIYYLKPKLKQCEALTNLDKSALHEGIINPDSQLLPIRLNHSLRDDGIFNTSQLNVIHNTKELVNRTSPGILLVQGPPGAGKTHTLIGMVKKIFLDWREKDSCPKILICAPSNGAIDEIGKRLFKEKDFLKKEHSDRSMRVVRIGQSESINEFVKKNLFIDSLIENNIKMYLEKRNNTHEEELEEKESELSKLTIEANNLERNKEDEKLKHVKAKMAQLKREINYLEKQQENLRSKKVNLNFDVLKKKYRSDLLQKADVILTTLSSCCNSSLLQVYNEKRIFNCCIIDEASQCSEPEILMPLSFNSISKLILIGDHMQLPATTISAVANKFGFGTSLFERFHKYLKDKPFLNQYYIMLNIQYRMHSEICSLPSRLFYKNRLGTDSRTDRRKFPLVPYLVFDVKDTKECKRNVKNIHNSRESDFVIKLTDRCANAIEKFVKGGIVKIGIITPYQGQRKLLEEGLKECVNSTKTKVEVNTIDGFQGREMDIIIISAVRSSKEHNGSIGFLDSFQRLNVAITRARNSLFICLNADSLQRNNLWKNLIEDSAQRRYYQSCSVDIDYKLLDNVICRKSNFEV